jgi:peptidoglycan hydrolase CwlO-like protein
MTATLESLSVEVQFARQEIQRLEQKIDKLDAKIEALDGKVERYYLTIKQFETEFKPIRNIIYGLVAIVLITLFTAIVAFAMKGGFQ